MRSEARRSAEDVSLEGRDAEGLSCDDGRQSAAAAAIQRGVQRLLREHGLASICELPLRNGRRADIVAIGPKSEVVIVEIKSSLADFRADGKWPAYRDYCDRLYFAVDADFPTEVLPEETGLIVADRYGGAFVRGAPDHKLAASRRKAMVLAFAQTAAERLQRMRDPGHVATPASGVTA